MPDRVPARPADGLDEPTSPRARRFAVGDPIGVDVRVGPLGLFRVRHVGVVSRTTPDGTTWVISSSARRGACHEETLEEFSCGSTAYELPIERRVDADEAVRRARSLLGARWSVLTANCEHVVSWCTGNEPRSPQLRAYCRVAFHVAAWTAAAAVTVARRRARA